MQTIDARIRKRIAKEGPGAAFTPNDFLDLASRDAVDKTLSRLAAQGVIRRLTRGLYEYPREHAELGRLSPNIETVARKLAGRHQIRLQPAGAYATNLLGLSEQVPAKVVFLTDGPSRRVKIGRQTIELCHTRPRNMATAGRLSGLLIQALRHLGKEHVTPSRVAHLKRTLPAKERKRLLKDLPLAPEWMHPLFRELA